MKADKTKMMENLEKTLDWMDDAPEQTWKMILPDLKEKLNEQVKSGDFLNEIRDEIITDGTTIQTLEAELAQLKTAIENFNKGKITFKQQYLKLLYEMLEQAITTIIEEGFAPRITVPIQVDENSKLPVYAKKGDSGADVFLQEEIIFPAGQTIIVKTGLRVALPDGWEIQVRPRSGLSLKSPLRIANSPGTIDSGYRDEIGIIITNIGQEDYKMKKYDRIAQLVLCPVYRMAFQKVDDVNVIGENRGGGFGSTGE